MDFESIIGFIIFIAISTLFSKDKKQGKNRRQQQTSQNPAEKEAVNSPQPAPAKSTAAPARRPQISGTNKLDDFLKEMQRDIRQVFGELQSTAGKQSTGKKPLEAPAEAPAAGQGDTRAWDYDDYFGRIEVPAVEEKQSTEASDHTILEVEPNQEEELPAAGGHLSFDRSSMIQAIIMSEILDKPKSLRG
jgi:hypothetical protein